MLPWPRQSRHIIGDTRGCPIFAQRPDVRSETDAGQDTDAHLRYRRPIHLRHVRLSARLTSRYSSRPYGPPSRPTPESFIPPSGAWGAMAEGTPSLTPTRPYSSASDTRNARARGPASRGTRPDRSWWRWRRPPPPRHRGSPPRAPPDTLSGRSRSGYRPLPPLICRPTSCHRPSSFAQMCVNRRVNSRAPDSFRTIWLAREPAVIRSLTAMSPVTTAVSP